MNTGRVRVWTAKTIGDSATETSEAILIERASICSLIVESFSGSTNVDFSFSVSSKKNGTFIAISDGSIQNAVEQADAFSFIPPPSKYLKIIAVNKTSTPVTLSAVLCYQDASY